MENDQILKKDTKMMTTRSGVFIVNFDQISHIVLVFALLFEQVTANWVITIC